MRGLRFGKRLWPGVVAGVMLVLLSTSAFAQCAMCRTALNSPGGAAMARNLNIGIIVLLIPPVAIFCGIFFSAYKHRNDLMNGPKKAP